MLWVVSTDLCVMPTKVFGVTASTYATTPASQSNQPICLRLGAHLLVVTTRDNYICRYGGFLEFGGRGGGGGGTFLGGPMIRIVVY